MVKYRLCSWFCLLLIICTAIGVHGKPYEVTYPEAGLRASVLVPSKVVAGGNATFSIVFFSERSLDVVVRICYLYGRGNMSGWEEAYRGPLSSKRKVEFNCTFKVPEKVETGPLIMWVYLEFVSENDHEVVAGENFYADWSFIVIGPYVVSKKDMERMEKIEELVEEVEALKSRGGELEQAVNELSLALDNITQQLEIAKVREAEAKFVYQDLESKLNKTMSELTLTKKKLETANIRNGELSRLVIILTFILLSISMLTIFIVIKYIRAKKNA